MRDHLDRHGYVHCAWIIAFLIFIVSVLIVRSPSSDKLQALTGFSATIASLFLALVAIFYSMVSNQDHGNIAQQTRDSADRIDVSTQELSHSTKRLYDIIEALQSNLDSIPGEISSVKSAFAERFDELRSRDGTDFDTTSTKAGSRPPDEETVGTALSLHILAKSKQEGRHVTVDTLPEELKYFSGYFLGFCKAFYFARPCGVDLAIAGGSVAVNSFGTLDISEYLSLDPSRFSGSPKSALKAFYEQLKVDTSNIDWGGRQRGFA